MKAIKEFWLSSYQSDKVAFYFELVSIFFFLTDFLFFIFLRLLTFGLLFLTDFFFFEFICRYLSTWIVFTKRHKSNF